METRYPQTPSDQAKRETPAKLGYDIPPYADGIGDMEGDDYWID